jgi:hypothetical protein
MIDAPPDPASPPENPWPQPALSAPLPVLLRRNPSHVEEIVFWSKGLNAFAIVSAILLLLLGGICVAVDIYGLITTLTTQHGLKSDDQIGFSVVTILGIITLAPAICLLRVIHHNRIARRRLREAAREMAQRLSSPNGTP